jgi:hypothetical protein
MVNFTIEYKILYKELKIVEILRKKLETRRLETIGSKLYFQGKNASNTPIFIWIPKVQTFTVITSGNGGAW